MERYVEPISRALIIAGILWIVGMVSGTNTGLQVLQSKIDDMKAVFGNQSKELDTLKGIASNHEARIMMLESKK